jgi:tetratricopeptide (TPR) repeat protein
MMKISWLFLPLAVVLAVPARLLSSPRQSETSTPAANLAVGTQLATLAKLHERSDQLASSIAQISEAQAPNPEPETTPEAVAAAVKAWLAQQELPAEVLTQAPNLESPALGPMAQLALPDLMNQVLQLPAFHPDSERIYQELRDAGRMDELLEGLKAQVEDDPSNPELRVTLGIAYLEKLFGLKGASREAGMLAMGADRSFDRALELDPNNVKGRFSKAVALSNWPPFMGKTSLAIEQFELLIKQSEQGSVSEPFSQPYLFLGNMHLRSGEREKAISVWNRGLQHFPGDAQLLAQLEAEGGS